ncbi:uncharacterized protein C19orf18 homolog [Eptesicus fuscus]|uniref:uncharacterized protein C19orf18 homolog n=1 Tax=Eptesicus fuscus TaxID=29078 RepID=UPI002404095C|nr:uncharacterized protein C19orf18 homolog [Eptesicus fuscus]
MGPRLHCGHTGDRKDDTPEPAKKDVSAHSLAPSPSAREAAPSPRRRALVRVVTIACTALSVALVCGVAASYVIYRLGQDEEREQLAALYENIQMPLSGDEEEALQAGRPGGSGFLLSGSEKELAAFINSEHEVCILAIRSNRRQRLEGAGLESAPKG